MTIPEVKQTDGAFTFLPIEDVFYGVDSINNLDEVLTKYNIQRALLITGGTLFNKTTLVDSVLNAANGRVTAVFHETKPHVPRGVVLKCIEIARKENVDAVISFGGGSPNDTAKAVIMGLAENFNGTTDFDRVMIKFQYPDKTEIPSISGDNALPLIAIPRRLPLCTLLYFTFFGSNIKN